VFADVVVATPQQIIPIEEQSLAARQAKPAFKRGHDCECGMHEPFMFWSTQHVDVFRLQVVLPHCCGPPS
jgi:hypothetical protein